MENRSQVRTSFRQIIRSDQTKGGIILKTLILLLLWSSVAFAGVDFAMTSAWEKEIAYAKELRQDKKKMRAYQHKLNRLYKQKNKTPEEWTDFIFLKFVEKILNKGSHVYASSVRVKGE